MYGSEPVGYASQGSSAMAGTVEPNPLAKIDNCIQGMHKMLEELETRLSPVLAPPGPSSLSENKSPPVNRIREIGIGADSACQRLKEILRRIEL